MKKFFILLLLLLITNNAYALSIIYDGFECADEGAISAVPAQSKFTIDEDLGNGNYKLLLEDAYLVFNDKICLELISNITKDPIDLKLHGLSPIKASAYFNGNALVITYGLTAQNSDIVRGNPILLTDNAFPSTYTLTFDYLPSRQAFKLKSVTRLNTLFTAVTSGESDHSQSFSSFKVEPIIPLEEIEFLLKE
ncbi:MAG: hypothetical protein LZF64_04215 [Nitrosomonas sp.]|uniref:hypothetical protein n=1 Tax=Nitrosomonas sp. TaxID=42353 RepID=UPI0025D2D083|nr:hypothetical protein [Nitrosomonas sp.]MCG7755542.1 hypothetical protein [Nitrosomonas sp.]UJP00984.1 MAG: hypothetical protein LZF64_04215 [Nitrosomonas sp.]UJP03283.1 MAG: hypothetical protein LZF85_02155 [Nitrosomonas sp.]